MAKGACRVGVRGRKRPEYSIYTTLLWDKTPSAALLHRDTHYMYYVWKYNYGSESEKRRERCLEIISIYGSSKCYTSSGVIGLKNERVQMM